MSSVGFQGFTGIRFGDMMDDETRNTGDDVSYGWNRQEIVQAARIVS